MGDTVLIPCPSCGWPKPHGLSTGEGVTKEIYELERYEELHELDGEELECSACYSTFVIRPHAFALIELLTEGGDPNGAHQDP